MFSGIDIEDKSNRNKVTRTIAKLKAHGLIPKIPHSFRYKVSKKGLKVMTAILRIKSKEYPLLVGEKAA